jgi:hypothetical protein
MPARTSREGITKRLLHLGTPRFSLLWAKKASPKRWSPKCLDDLIFGHSGL